MTQKLNHIFLVLPSPLCNESKIEQEIDCLVKEGIYESVSPSKWIASIEPVDGGSTRICGDFKA